VAALSSECTLGEVQAWAHTAGLSVCLSVCLPGIGCNLHVSAQGVSETTQELAGYKERVAQLEADKEKAIKESQKKTLQEVQKARINFQRDVDAEKAKVRQAMRSHHVVSSDARHGCFDWSMARTEVMWSHRARCAALRSPTRRHCCHVASQRRRCQTTACC
jgi:hypothetical protein